MCPKCRWPVTHCDCPLCPGCHWNVNLCRCPWSPVRLATAKKDCAGLRRSLGLLDPETVR